MYLSEADQSCKLAFLTRELKTALFLEEEMGFDEARETVSVEKLVEQKTELLRKVHQQQTRALQRLFLRKLRQHRSTFRELFSSEAI